MLTWLCPGLPANAQLTVGLNTDSLKQRLHTAPADTNKVHLYITLGQQYEGNLPDSALYFYIQARRLSEKLSYPRGMIRFINNYTAVLNMLGRYVESLQYNQEGIEICRKHGLQRELGMAYGNTGAVYQYMEDFPKAIDYYLKSRPLMEQYSDAARVSLLYGNLSGLYRSIYQPNKAAYYARRALVLAEQTGDDYAIGNACINLAVIYKIQEKYDSALPVLNRAHKLGVSLNYLNLQENALIDIGSVYLAMNQPAKYRAAYTAALPLADTLGDVSGKAYILLGLTTGLYNQQRFAEAEHAAQHAIAFADSTGQKEVLASLYTLMADIQTVSRRFAKADSYKTKHDSLQNVLYNEKAMKQVQELETRYHVEQQQNELLRKDLQLQQSTAEAARQRLWLVGAAVGVVLLLLLLALLYNSYRQKQLLNRKNLEATRLKALVEGQTQERQRISQELHDDMGTGLTTILFVSRSLANPAAQTLETYTRLTTLAGSLIDKMNEIVWAMSNDHDSLPGLVTYIRTNTAETLRDADIDVTFALPPEIPDIALTQHIRHQVYLIVKEAVHNIIKHADAGAVAISMAFGTELTIRIHDNGKGINNTTSTTGNGLRNMQRRAAAISGTLNIFRNNGTVVELHAPLDV